jgi:PAS domain S-box-containing protein/diguanylate cyclase (GGDEF)-like protein
MCANAASCPDAANSGGRGAAAIGGVRIGEGKTLAVATILVVDDDPANREFLVILLGYQMHHLLEASNGAEALLLVRTHHPDIVITDILMPTMDGYEFVRQLRTDPAIAATAVVFFTANYLKNEAESLAKGCGVSHILTKPCKPELIRRVVEELLRTQRTSSRQSLPQDFAQQHLRVITDKLSKTAEELGISNHRLAALVDINLDLVSERDHQQLLNIVCPAARNLVGAKYAALAARPLDSETEVYFVTSGVDAATVARMGRPELCEGVVGSAFVDRKSRRLTNPRETGLPPHYPPAHSLLVAPIVSPAHVHGWICLTDKIGADEFSAEDEQLLGMLAAQVGRIYENGRLHDDVRRYATRLEAEVNQHNRAQESLIESEKRFREMAENIRDVFFLIDAHSNRILYISPAYAEVWGRSCESVYADPEAWTEAIHPEDRATTYENFKAGMSGGKFDCEYRIVRPDRSIRWIEARIFPIRSDDGRIVRVAGVASDITERKLVADELQERDRRFSDLLGNVELISMMLDKNARITYCNDYLLRLSGWRREELLGQNWFKLFVPSDVHNVETVFASLLAGLSQARHHENEILARSGERRLIRWNNSLLRSGTGEVIGTASIGEDITEQRRYQESLRQNEERTRLIVESALDAVVVMDATGGITDWNSQAENTFGWTREQVIGKAMAETIIPTRDRQAHRHGLRKFLETGEGPILNKRTELSAMHRDGRELPVELTVSPVRHGGGWIFSAFIRDLTERKRAEQALVQLRRRSELILESVGEGIHGIDLDGKIIFENSAATKLLGYAMQELTGKSAHATMHHSRKDGTPHPVADCAIHATMYDGAIRRVEDEVFWRKDGSSFPVEYTTAPIRNDRNQIEGAVVAFRDITERMEAENRIRRLNRVYAMLSGINALIVRVHDREALFKETCRMAVEAGGFKMAWIGVIDPQTLDGKIVACHGGEEIYADNIRLTAREGTPDSERPACRALRQSQPVICNDIATDASVGDLRDELLRRGHRSLGCFPLMMAGRPAAVIALFAGEPDAFDEEELRLLSELSGDISFALDHIEREEKLNYLAYYDVLTGLANRSLFLERVAQHLRNAVSGGHKVAVALIDLERFKNINHSLGRAAGDALLRQVADWLTHSVGDTNLLARVDADHFAVVLPKVKHVGELARLVEKTTEALLQYPFRQSDTVFRVAAKTGVALFPDDGADADTLLKNAEAALKKAKMGGDRYLFYAQKMTETALDRLNLENQLREAFDKEEFVLHYQPKVNLATGKLTGAEALIRWNDPRTGLVPPGRFISVMEETGLIHEVGRWALRKAIEDYLRWHNAGLAAVRISVNVSQLQLRNRGFIAEIDEAISIDAQAAGGLELEITESVIMDDVKHIISHLQSIRAMGVGIAIDDFGTGFSSLSYLSKLPVDTLKIDRSFVVDMTDAPKGLALVSSIINLAHSLQLKVVAEGVETEEQSRLLRLLSCDEMQGYFFSKPVPREIFEARFLAHPSGG